MSLSSTRNSKKNKLRNLYSNHFIPITSWLMMATISCLKSGHNPLLNKSSYNHTHQQRYNLFRLKWVSTSVLQSWRGSRRTLILFTQNKFGILLRQCSVLILSISKILKITMRLFYKSCFCSVIQGRSHRLRYLCLEDLYITSYCFWHLKNSC